VRLQLHTDRPATRLTPGARFATDPASAGPLELVSAVERSGSVYARFAGHDDRTAAEALRGVVLLAEPEPEDEAWYPEQLAGLQARRPDGSVVGTISGVQYLPAQDVLVLDEPDGVRTLVPFVEAIVPVVDVEAGFVVIDAPAGLLAADGDVGDEPGSPPSCSGERSGGEELGGVVT
jgi:16S rRNA processing protein RimM